jgi:hypothetical protein
MRRTGRIQPSTTPAGISSWPARSELVRERREAASKLRLLRGFVGYATSLAACEKEPGLEEVLRDVPEVHAYLARKGMTFDDVVTVKREQRLAL